MVESSTLARTGDSTGIPQEDWRIDWEKSQLQTSAMEQLIEKKIKQQLEQGAIYAPKPPANSRSGSA